MSFNNPYNQKVVSPFILPKKQAIFHCYQNKAIWKSIVGPKGEKMLEDILANYYNS